MEFLKAAVVAIMTLLLILTCVSSMNATNSSLSYCNQAGDPPVTTTGEVCNAIFDSMGEIDDLCADDEVVSKKA